MSDFKWQNNGKIKICIGLGTRPEIIRLAAVIRRCREYFDKRTFNDDSGQQTHIYHRIRLPRTLTCAIREKR